MQAEVLKTDLYPRLAEPAGDGDQVLIVDDERRIIDALTDLLEDDYEIFGASSAEDALRSLKDHPGIAVILCDQRMPGVTGDKLLAIAKKVSPAVRVLVTGYADLSAVIRAVNDGSIFRYISKPWDPTTIKQTVAEALEVYRLNQSLASEGQLLRELLASTTDAIAFKDTEHRYVELNMPAARVLGITHPGEALGKTAADFIPENRAAAWHAAEAKLLADGIPIDDSVESVTDEDGTEHWYTVSKAPIKTVDGEICGLVSITRDITEAKQLDRLKDEFVSIVNHEMRTPLTAMQGSLALLSSGKLAELPENVHKLVDVSHRNCQRLTRLITDILDYGSLRRGEITLNLQETDLIGLIEREIGLAESDYGKACPRIRFDHELPTCPVSIDPERIAQVVHQLLSNAVTHAPAGSEIAVVVSKAGGGRIDVSVSNDGSSIPEPMLQTIFNPFAQVDGSDRRLSEGVGLGLSICRCIVEGHGGEIELRNRAEGGVTVEFTLSGAGPDAST